VSKAGIEAARRATVALLHVKETDCDMPLDSNCLRSVTLGIRSGSLVGVCGGVGSGKSSLLSAALGLVEIMDGSISVAPRIAYVAQQAWILSDTLRNNITFGEVH
jgi:ABC-type multidrug transport system fused ATPase/permease subunit